MPHSDEQNKYEERIARNESRRNKIFKVVEILLWLIVIIIVVGIIVLITLNTYGTEPIPVDAIPTFYQ